MKPATQEEINALSKYLDDNNLALQVDIITTYPNGVANTRGGIMVMVKENKEEELTKSEE